MKSKKRGSRRLDMSGIREAMMDRRYWVGVGIVYHPSGEEKHFEVDEDIGVLVHVRLMPKEEPLMCRLAGLGQGTGSGVWRVPPVGSEVAVGLIAGEVDETMLLGVLSSGGVPDELDEDTLVVKSPKIVIIADGAVEVGGKDLANTDGVVHGTGIDSFTGATYFALGSTSSRLRAKKT